MVLIHVLIYQVYQVCTTLFSPTIVCVQKCGHFLKVVFNKSKTRIIVQQQTIILCPRVRPVETTARVHPCL